MLTLALAVLLAAAGVLAVAYPLIQGRGRGTEKYRGDYVQELLDQHDTLTRGLKELESDRSLGKLSTEEYDLLREAYGQQVNAVHQALEAHSNGMDAEIEQEVLIERERRRRGA